MVSTEQLRYITSYSRSEPLAQADATTLVAAITFWHDQAAQLLTNASVLISDTSTGWFRLAVALEYTTHDCARRHIAGLDAAMYAHRWCKPHRAGPEIDGLMSTLSADQQARTVITLGPAQLP